MYFVNVLQGNPEDSESGSWLSGSAYKPFWCSWTDGQIKLGTGSIVGLNTFLSASSAQPVNYVGVATAFGSDGVWAFGHGRVNIF